MTFRWERDDFDDGKLRILYRHQRFLDEGWMGKRVLDIGGWGKMSFRLAQEGIEVVLLDLSREILERVKGIKDRHSFNEFELIRADAHFLPFRSGFLDTIHSSETLEHVKSAEHVCDEVFKILKPGGIYCGTVPIPGYCHKRGEEGIRFFSESELRELLSKYHILKLEKTPSIKPGNVPCSIMFVARAQPE